MQSLIEARLIVATLHSGGNICHVQLCTAAATFGGDLPCDARGEVAETERCLGLLLFLELQGATRDFTVEQKKQRAREMDVG